MKIIFKSIKYGVLLPLAIIGIALMTFAAFFAQFFHGHEVEWNKLWSYIYSELWENFKNWRK